QQGKPTSTNPIASIFLDARANISRSHGRNARRGQISGNAGKGLRRRRGIVQDDQGSGNPDTSRPPLPLHRRIHGRRGRGTQTARTLTEARGEGRRKASAQRLLPLTNKKTTGPQELPGPKTKRDLRPRPAVPPARAASLRPGCSKPACPSGLA